MLSLMIVLSAYYMMSNKNGDFAYVDQNTTDLDKPTATEAEEPDILTDDSAVTEELTNVGQDQLFSLLRMELQDKRSMEKGHLKEVMASNTATTEEKSAALTDIQTIDEVSSKESILQNTILSTKEDYQDVLVRLDKDVVHVHLIVDELPKQEVVQIMQMVRDEFGERTVNVNFQPTEG